MFVSFPCSFVMNLGKDATHLGLHFNPRFDAHGDVNTIVCNSKKVEEWGAEQRETVFPFQKGAPAEVRPGMVVKGGRLAQGTQLASPAWPVPPSRALSSGDG